MKIQVIIPTLKNRENVLLTCLGTLLNQTSMLDWDLIICTNNPELKATDRNDEMMINRFLKTIEHRGHKVTVIQDQIKTGPGRAVQQLLDYIDENVPACTHVLRVDDDIVLENDVLTKLIVTYTYEENVAAVACPANGFGVGPVDYVKYWSEDPPKHLIGNGTYTHLNDNCMAHSTVAELAIAEVDFLSGYCLLIDREKVKQVGGYVTDEAPHYQNEDWYATLRLKEAGFRLLIRADAFAYHHHHQEIDDGLQQYRKERSDLDKSIFRTYRDTVKLPEDRTIGLIRYEP